MEKAEGRVKLKGEARNVEEAAQAMRLAEMKLISVLGSKKAATVLATSTFSIGLNHINLQQPYRLVTGVEE